MTRFLYILILCAVSSSVRAAESGLQAGPVFQTPDRGETRVGCPKDLAPGPVRGVTAPAGAIALHPGDDIQARLTAAEPGAVFYLAPGVYRGQYNLSPRSRQKLIGAYGAVLNGARVVNGWTRHAPGVWKAEGQPKEAPKPSGQFQSANGPHVRVIGGWEANGLPQDLYVDDKPLRRVGRLEEVAAGRWFYDYAAGIIYLGVDPAGKRVEISEPGKRALSCDRGQAPEGGIVLRNLVIEKYGAPAQEAAIDLLGAGGGADNVRQADNGLSGGCVVDHCTIRLNHGGGIYMGPGCTLIDSDISENGNVGVKGMGAHGTVARCRASRNNYNHYDVLWEGAGMKFWSVRCWTVRDNEVSDNLGTGIWFDYCFYDNQVRGNTCRNNARAGVSIEMTISARVAYNELDGNDGIDAGNSGYAAGGIFVFNGMFTAVEHNVLGPANNGGILFLRQERATMDPANAEKGSRSGVALSLRGTVCRYNTIHMTKGFTGIELLPQADYAPYASQDGLTFGKATFGYPADGTPPMVVFDYNTYLGTGYESDKGGSDGMFKDTAKRFCWGGPAGYEKDLANIYTWTSRRFGGWDDYRAHTGQDAHSILK